MDIINSRDLNTNGTHFLQSVRATYWELVEAFGHPTYADPKYLDDKLNVEWVLEIDGVVATIYDWKIGTKEYSENTLWNIGGHGQRVASKIIDILEKKAVA